MSKPRVVSSVGLAWVIIATFLGAILIDIQIAEARKMVEVAEVMTVEEPKEVRIEVVYDSWDKDRIIKEIKDTFPEAPELAVAIAKCESNFNTKAYNPTNNSHDKGIMQISEKYHGTEVKRLGLDMNNPKDNIKFARRLYEQAGNSFSPWVCYTKKMY